MWDPFNNFSKQTLRPALKRLSIGENHIVLVSVHWSHGLETKSGKWGYVKNQDVYKKKTTCFVADNVP